MLYTLLLEPSPEGYAASVPELAGCHSQGATEGEAIENIREAIREYGEVVEELTHTSDAKRGTVEV